jgi:hypothetical protein
MPGTHGKSDPGPIRVLKGALHARPRQKNGPTSAITGPVDRLKPFGTGLPFEQVSCDLELWLPRLARAEQESEALHCGTCRPRMGRSRSWRCRWQQRRSSCLACFRRRKEKLEETLFVSGGRSSQALGHLGVAIRSPPAGPVPARTILRTKSDASASNSDAHRSAPRNGFGPGRP